MPRGSQAGSSPAEVALETGTVCFNQQGCNLMGTGGFWPGVCWVFLVCFGVFCVGGAWSGSWMGGGIWILLKCYHSMEKPPAA